MTALPRTFHYVLSNSATPGSLAATAGISVDFFSSGYLDVSVPQVRLLNLCIQLRIPALRRVGFPIQKSPGQRLVATSPELIAGSNVFHRLQLPRHPPYALSRLTINAMRLPSITFAFAFYHLSHLRLNYFFAFVMQYMQFVLIVISSLRYR